MLLWVFAINSKRFDVGGGYILIVRGVYILITFKESLQESKIRKIMWAFQVLRAFNVVRLLV